MAKVNEMKYRPKIHFTPSYGWQNDPNGLIYNNGYWHLYYQFNPDDIVWGPMHWGHAISRDLYHWEDLPIALAPDKLGYMFSGSMVYDRNNTSGLGKINEETGELVAPMIAAYTSHEPDTWVETQSIGISLDGGKTITPYENNPVIDYFLKPDGKIEKDFRDPKVFRNKYTNCWTMVVAANKECQFHTSDDLIHWTKQGSFHHDFKEITNCWACTDLIPFETEDGLLWVLLASMEDRPSDPRSNTMYFVGTFDGKNFIPVEKYDKPRWIDFGWDNYAGVSYNDIDEPVMISWGINPRYANFVPSGETEQYRGLMTCPRKLELKKKNGSYYVAFIPYHLDAVKQDETIPMEKETGLLPTCLLEIHGQEGRVTFENENGEKADITFTKDSITIDRRNSGLTKFHDYYNTDEFSLGKAVRINSDDINMKILFDVSYIEVFADGGLEAGSMVVYPTTPYTKVVISEGLNGTMTELK